MKCFASIFSKRWSNASLNKLSKSMFNDDFRKTLDIIDSSFHKLERLNIPIPKRESLLIYRDALKICKKFYWNNGEGKQWSEILLKAVRKDFENNRFIDDTVEAGKKQVQARQALIELENKLAKVSFDIKNFIEDTKINPNQSKLPKS